MYNRSSRDCNPYPPNQIKRKLEMAAKIIPHQLAESLNYNPNTGDFVWKVSTSKRTKAGSPAGSVYPVGRLYISYKGSAYQAHRVAWFMHYGEQPPALIDHIDQDPLNNRISNLRKATRSLNAMNKPAKGVYRDGDKWRAMIRLNGKLTQLYRGPDYSKAVRARESAVRDYWSHYA
jgi:hypothetical protein